MSSLKNIHHPDLKADQQLMMAIDELGIVRRDQLAECLGWTENSVHTYIHRIRRNAVKTDTLRDDWIQIIHPPRDAKIRCYKLGIQGLQVVRNFRSLRPGKMEERSDAQWKHYLGLNDILVRLIQAVKDPQEQEQDFMHTVLNRIKWHNTWAATDFLFRSMELMYQEEWKKDPKKARDERKEIIHPDAYLIFDEIARWIEYDNDTEAPRIIEKKLREYVKTLNRVDNHDPVIWVAPTEKRKNELKDIWEYIQGTFDVVENGTIEENQVSFLPEMYFFQAGEEVEFIVPTVVSV